MGKKQNKTAKIIKGIVIGVLAVILIAVGAGIGYYQFYIKPKVIEPLRQNTQGSDSVPSAFSVTTILDELEKTLQEEDVKEYLDSTNPGQTNELLEMIETAKNKQTDQAESQKSQVNSDVGKSAEEQSKNTASNEPTAQESTQKPTPSIKNDKKTSEPTKAPSEESRYEQIKSQVNPGDFSAALSIAGKVDAGYISGLMAGGLTSEEKSELKQYLMSRLSSSEISKGIQLFAEYSYLLN